jgi:hypothetical protein
MNEYLKKAIDVLAAAGFGVRAAKVETWRDLGIEGEGIRYHFPTGYINLRITPKNDPNVSKCLDFGPPLPKEWDLEMTAE